MGELVAQEAQGQGGAKLTDQQRKLVDALQRGASQDEAAAVAGYDNSVSFGNAMRSPIVQGALLESRKALIGGALATKALKAIEGLVTDERTPAATRLAASKWVLEQAGHGGSSASEDDKPLHEMTEQELARFMARAQAVVDSGGEPPLIAIKPDNGA